jgi:hypothetical protein
MPRLLNFIVAIYLIVIGLVGVFHLWKHSLSITAKLTGPIRKSDARLGFVSSMLQHQGAVEPSGGVALSADNKAYPVKSPTTFPRSSRTHFLAWKVRRHTPTSVLKLFKTTLSTADLRWLASRTEYVRCLRIAFAVFTLAVAGPSVALRLSGSWIGGLRASLEDVVDSDWVSGRATAVTDWGRASGVDSARGSKPAVGVEESTGTCVSLARSWFAPLPKRTMEKQIEASKIKKPKTQSQSLDANFPPLAFFRFELMSTPIYQGIIKSQILNFPNQALPWVSLRG